MDFERLAKNAEPILEMLNDIFTTPKGVDIRMALLYSAGLAGVACHEAVKAQNGNFVEAGTADGRTFYLGEDLNKYLLEDQYSTLSFLKGFFQRYSDGQTCPDPMKIVEDNMSVLGTPGHKIWGRFECENVYKMVRQRWDDIFDDMTSKYCESPEEWPVLYSIVLQNVMVTALQAAPVHGLFIMALECAWYISKMDFESL